MILPFNPFSEYSVANYSQYKKYPNFLCSNLDVLKNRTTQQIEQIKAGHYFGDRSLILGERGIGKTTSLYFIQDMLKDSNIQIFNSSRLIEDNQHFELITGRSINKAVGANGQKRPFYLLIDFPDEITPSKFKRFLQFLWDIFVNEEIYNYVNLVFALNKSHYDKSFSYSEVLGKFLTLRLERFTYDETEELIQTRLKVVGAKIKDIFAPGALAILYNYSQGIPRNIISAANMLVASNIFPVSEKKTKRILKEEYINKIIVDRIEDRALRALYSEIVRVLKQDFQGTVDSQERLIQRLADRKIISRVTAIKHIQKLIDIGVFSIQKGGYNRLNKIISIQG